MKKLLLVNTLANSGSTGRIAEEIGRVAQSQGYKSYFGYGRIARESQAELIKIGNKADMLIHCIESRLFDNHGFSSRTATRRFIEEVERIHPDIINLHNIHGYYLNIDILFNYISKKDIPVVWTLHDCWPFTGHCTFLGRNCEKWKTGCHDCQSHKGYPKSLYVDRSLTNFARKRALFTLPRNITFVAVCHWMEGLVKSSFLGGYPVETIYNGINTDIFKPQQYDTLRKKYGISESDKVILGVASIWDKRKGLSDFIQLRSTLADNYKIILVGLNDKQIQSLPQGIIGVQRTESAQQLAGFYSMADVFANPTYLDNFPTTNIEALSCGTPVITYATGGSPEAIDNNTGMVIPQGDLSQLKTAINAISGRKQEYAPLCRERAVRLFNKNDRYNDYVKLFDRIISSH